MLRRTQPNSLPTEAPRILPHDVKFALKHRDAMLNPNDVRRLFDNRLGHLGFYVAMKASDGNHDVQAGLLRRVVERRFDLGRLTRTDASEALEYLAAQDPPQVKAKKIAPIDGLGLDVWNQRFTQTLEPVLREEGEPPLFVVANSPFVGLGQIAALTLDKGRPLGIIKPSRFGQTDGPVGFMIEPTASGHDITPLSHDFVRPERAVIFDDAIETGSVRDQVLQFWGSPETPSFISVFVNVQAQAAPEAAGHAQAQ